MSQQDVFFNELCLRQEVISRCSIDRAVEWFNNFAELLRQLSRHRRLNRLRIHSDVKRMILAGYPFSALLKSTESPLPETVRQIVASRIESAPYLEETKLNDDQGVFEWDGRYYEFHYQPLEQVVLGLGAAFLNHDWAVSIPTENEHWGTSQIEISTYSMLPDASDEQTQDHCPVWHASSVEHLGIPKRVYDPSRKHEKPDAGGWGTPMDLTPDEAQTLLETAIANPAKASEKALYNYSPHTKRMYEFRSDSPDAGEKYHGYPIPGVQAGIQVLRILCNDGIISQVEKKRLHGQSSLD